MKTMNKVSLMILALLLALTLSAAAFAEGTETAASEAAPAAADQAVTDAQAEANALSEALTAYGNAKAESRKQELLDSLKQELDGYVAAGRLTQDQADLILKYYTEQMTLNGGGFGRGGKGMRNGQGMQPNGQNSHGTQPNGFGKGGRHGRFSNSPAAPDAVSGATPEQGMPAAPDGTSGT